MCGIFGFHSSLLKGNGEILKKMSSVLIHRGPDYQGFFEEDNIGLGHNRLSIIDLSSRSNQPMISKNQRYVIIYNGEVYNFEEIATEIKLKNKNFNDVGFISNGDTEIILEAFSLFGPKFVEKLNGMFSIVIYDRITKELYLFRDRIGIKPLYYYWDDKSFYFASELKGITNVIEKKLTINYDAVYSFLHLGFIPFNLSIFNEIKKLLPGCYLHFSSEPKIVEYWNLENCIENDLHSDEKKSIEILDDLINSSVNYQIRSDVPLGVFLSGGIDSSLIASKVVKFSKNKVNTFSIGFEDDNYNESIYARKIASFLNTNHFEFIVSYNDALEFLDEMLDLYDEPFADSSALPTMLVSRLAKKEATVVLSGEGGDELFMGYGSYVWANRLNHPFSRFFSDFISRVLKSTKNNKYKRAAKLFDNYDGNLKQSHIFSQEQYLFSSKELEGLGFNKRFNINSVLNFSLQEKNRNLNPAEKQAFFDLKYYLPEDLLTKVDRASMRFQIETRVPFLDHRIIEFALNLSSDLKIKNGVSKFILKEILFKEIPGEFFDRPKKGFSIPLKEWLKKELSYLIPLYLNKEVLLKFKVVDYDYVVELLNNFRNGEDYLYNRIWSLIILHRWLVKNEERIIL